MPVALPLDDANSADKAVSVILPTHNRSASLQRAVESLFRSSQSSSCEVLIVDNGSSDDTPQVASRLETLGPVRYLREPRPGVAFARNLGASVARAPVLAFMDDDQSVGPAWVDVIARTFDTNPALHFLAGRVLPPPGAELPAWVTPRTRGALSIIDKGVKPAPIDAEHWMCLPGGNMACRRAVFESVGGFRPYRRSQDRELTVRLLQAGYRGQYVPDMLMYHEIEPARVTPDHFRRWVATEGRIRARYRFDELFDREGRLLPAPVASRRVFGVSGFVYRQLLGEAGGWLMAKLRRRPTEAFAHELRARYLAHYVAGAVEASGALVDFLGRFVG